MQFPQIEAHDPDLAAAMLSESDRQLHKLELIASENFVSPAVLEASGSILTNKHAEGYPGRRYYGGCEFVDQVETLAIERARELYGAEHANVQPHSGSSANLCALFALLEVGDVVMGMNLAHGGHLTHGLKVNFSGRFFNIVPYGVRQDTETLDYDEIEKIARETKPRLIIAGHSAYPRQIDFERFRWIADQVDAYLMVDMAHFSGLVAAGEHPSPVPHADVVTSTTHKTLRGPRSGFILCKDQYAKAIGKTVFPGFQGGPLMHIIAAKAVAFGEALTPGFKRYAREIRRNAEALGKALTAEGLRLVSGGTENHLLLADLTSYEISGRQAEEALDHASITCNKNMIPFDQRKPTETSGIRLGLSALTSGGMTTDDMQKIAGWMAQVLRDPTNETVQNNVAKDIRGFATGFPLHISVYETEGAAT